MASGNENKVAVDLFEVSSESSSNASGLISSSESASESGDNVRPYLRKKKLSRKAEKTSCSKLTLPEHLAAHMEERELDRDVEPIQCSEDMLENIFNNYVIVKNILSHLRWQEKLICKDVCPLWNSAVNRLQTEQLEPVDFSIFVGTRAVRKGVKLLKSSECYTEPMAIFTFGNTSAFSLRTVACEAITPSPCSPVCDQEHSILDIIYQETTAPRDCMYAVKVYNMSYLPIAQSKTFENAIRKPTRGSDSYFCGIYIPKIPGVEFRIINVNCSSGIQQELIPEIKKLTTSYVIKGVVACLTDNYLLYEDEENAQCLGFLQALQPNIPFAFGGCLVEDTVNTEQDLAAIVDNMNKGTEFISGNKISLGLFITPKDENSSAGPSSPAEPKQNFEIYSFVIEASEWSKLKIQQAIQEFSERVPRFEHSVALKFSCMGREHKHEAEQNCFRRFFPNTRIVGCFGNGELGISHPKRKPRTTPTKRAREDLAYEKVHSYSTVLFYIGWGKITEEAECDD